MLRYPIILGLSYATVVWQSQFHAASPEVATLFVPATMLVLIAAWASPSMAIACSALLGFVLDGISPERLGIQMALTTVIAMLLQIMRPIWKSGNPLALTLTVVIATLAWRTSSPLIYAVLSRRTVDPALVFQQAMRDSAITSIFSLLLFLVLRGLTPRTNRQSSYKKVRFA